MLHSSHPGETTRCSTAFQVFTVYGRRRKALEWQQNPSYKAEVAIPRVRAQAAGLFVGTCVGGFLPLPFCSSLPLPGRKGQKKCDTFWRLLLYRGVAERGTLRARLGTLVRGSCEQGIASSRTAACSLLLWHSNANSVQRRLGFLRAGYRGITRPHCPRHPLDTSSICDVRTAGKGPLSDIAIACVRRVIVDAHVSWSERGLD